MTFSAERHRLECEEVGDVTVVRFIGRTILTPDLITAIAEQLEKLEQAGRRRFVLNFNGVQTVTTAMVGTLVGLHKRATATGGRVVLCHVDPFLSEVFKVCRLPELMSTYPDEQTALQSF